jgi:cobalamin biosynthesis Mg chelatase CobN
MLKRQAFAPFVIVAMILALTGILFAQNEVALAQANTPEPAEEAAPTAEPAEEAAPTAEPTEEAAPTAAAPTASPTQEAAPAQAAPTAAPAQEAASTAAAPTTLPTTGVASNPLPIFWVVVGTVAVFGMISGYSALRKRTPPD